MGPLVPEVDVGSVFEIGAAVAAAAAAVELQILPVNCSRSGRTIDDG